MNLVILPHNMASEGAKLLAESLRCVRIRRDNSRYKHRAQNIIINWGCPEKPEHTPSDAIILNSFAAVARASNKMEAFRQLDHNGVNIPKYTDNKSIAKQWVEDGRSVVARTVLNGHGGLGIVLIDSVDQMVDAPLYTEYIPKKSEYRVHVAYNQVIDVTRKTLRGDHPDKANVNWRIRNLDGGFIFSRYNKNHFDADGEPSLEMGICPSSVMNQAQHAVNALGLDFGAVDVVYNQSRAMAYVLEVNTAPGIADTAVELYTKAFNWYKNNMEDRGEDHDDDDDVLEEPAPRRFVLERNPFNDPIPAPAPPEVQFDVAYHVGENRYFDYPVL